MNIKTLHRASRIGDGLEPSHATPRYAEDCKADHNSCVDHEDRSNADIYENPRPAI